MPTIPELYNQNPRGEWDRLERRPYNQLEFEIFIRHLLNHLPGRGRILDAGGGPGRYALQLCVHGYDVLLLDAAQGCLDLARAESKALEADAQGHFEDPVLGDIRDLSRFPPGAFDAVLCLDPLSCLPDPADRERATAELVRVAKTGAPVALAVRGYLDVLRTMVRLGGSELIDGSLEELRRSGNCLCAGLPHHFFRAAELQDLAERHGLRTILLAGGEGLSSGMTDATDALADDPEKWGAWLDVLFETSTEPGVADTSGHFLLIGIKN